MPNGAFRYIPQPGFFGVDSFTYQAISGPATSSVATVYITVYSTPTAVDDSYATAENQELDINAPGVQGNDTNADGNPITAVLNSLPTNGTLLNFPGDGSFSYLPNAGFYGTDSFTYTDENGPATSNVATVSITVYSTPMAVDDNYVMAENQELDLAAPGVLVNDTNADGNPITPVVNSLPNNGTLLKLLRRRVLQLSPGYRLLWHGQLHLL